MKRKKRNYLYRLAIVMVAGLILPAILAFNILHWYAIRGWGKSTENFYEQALNTYTSLLDNKIRELETFSAKISAESRESGNMLQSGSASFSENAWQLYMTVRNLNEKYARNDVSEWGIYFYDVDKIITPEYSYTPENFIYKYTGQSMDTASCADFFSEENYLLLNTIFDSTNREGYYDGSLLIGVCTRIGINNERALIFYVLSPDDVSNSLAIVGGEGVSYYLLNQESGQLFLSWGDDSQETPETVLKSPTWEKISGIRQKVLYNIASSYQPLSVEAHISQNSLQSTILDWVGNMKMILICTVIILLLTCSIAIYIAYKPMYELTSEFDYSGGNEFDIIRHKFNDQSLRIDEQQMLILDLLLNHLIYGIPISEEQIKQLGIEGSLRHYCVFLLEGYTFVNREVEQLTLSLERTYGIRIFTTDWHDENCSIMIFFLKESDISFIRTGMEEWLQKKNLHDCSLYTGKVCDRLEDIQLSFRSCLDQLKKKNGLKQKKKPDVETLTPKKEQQKKMAEEILSYLETHYRDSSLSQIQVADLFRISNYTLSRLFKNQVGVGFAEYLAAKRLEYAKELLLTTTYSVKEISVMSGFTSENYFSRTFKLYEGVSPSVFRSQ